VSPRFSVYLDAVRFCAALVVVLSHFAYARFSGGWLQGLRDLNLGSDAVVLFFVLSGFVIAHAAATKDRTLGAYAFNRATRIFSVAAPAVLLTLALDAMGRAANPAAYDGWWFHDASPAMQMLRGLSFSNELWFESYRLGSNGPFWSLAYEIWFYALFGAATYLRGARRVLAVGAIALTMGPKMLALLPAWLCGVAAYRLASASAERRTVKAFALAAAPPVLYGAALAFGLPNLLRAVTEAALGAEFVRGPLGFSDEFLWNNLIALGALAHFIGMARLLRGAGERKGVWVWCAGATFSLYLVHYPLMQCAAAFLPAQTPLIGAQIIILAVSFGGALLFAEAFERPLSLWRDLARRRLRGRVALIGG